MIFNAEDIIVNNKLIDNPGTWDFESEVDRGLAVVFLILQENLTERTDETWQQ